MAKHCRTFNSRHVIAASAWGYETCGSGRLILFYQHGLVENPPVLDDVHLETPFINMYHGLSMAMFDCQRVVMLPCYYYHPKTLRASK
jgi:hypothetical protein